MLICSYTSFLDAEESNSLGEGVLVVASLGNGLSVNISHVHNTDSVQVVNVDVAGVLYADNGLLAVGAIIESNTACLKND